MQIRITLRGTPAELAEFCKEKGIDLQVAADGVPALLESNRQVESADSAKIDKAFRKMSWETLHLAHLVLMNAGLIQRDEFGYYLTLEQVEAFGISERQVASRVGGAKRICKRLDMDYILFSRRQSDGPARKYYLAAGAVPDLQNFLDRWNFEYREYLDEAGLTYPGEK